MSFYLMSSTQVKGFLAVATLRIYGYFRGRRRQTYFLAASFAESFIMQGKDDWVSWRGESESLNCHTHSHSTRLTLHSASYYWKRDENHVAEICRRQSFDSDDDSHGTGCGTTSADARKKYVSAVGIYAQPINEYILAIFWCDDGRQVSKQRKEA